MEDKEIVKALECCKNDGIICFECPYKKANGCMEKLSADALDLINRQDEEINRLQADSKRLKKVQMQLDDAMKMYHVIQAEALKEFVYDLMQIPNVSVYKYEIKNLLKEKLGGQSLNDVKCIDCEYLELELPYAVCSKAYKGMVHPNDSCGKGKLKEKGCE